MNFRDWYTAVYELSMDKVNDSREIAATMLFREFSGRLERAANLDKSGLADYVEKIDKDIKENAHSGRFAFELSNNVARLHEMAQEKQLNLQALEKKFAEEQAKAPGVIETKLNPPSNDALEIAGKWNARYNTFDQEKKDDVNRFAQDMFRKRFIELDDEDQDNVVKAYGSSKFAFGQIESSARKGYGGHIINVIDTTEGWMVTVDGKNVGIANSEQEGYTRGEEYIDMNLSSLKNMRV